MKTPNTLYSRLALITSVTLITGYLIVSATWTSMNNVGTGDQLSANLWNTFVNNLNDLDTRLKSTASTWPTVAGGIAYTGGNVGIGTTSPNIGGNGVGLTTLTIQGSTTNRGILELGTSSAQSNGVAGQIAFFNASTLTSVIQNTTDGLNSDSGLLKFLTKGTASAISERMRIDPIGNVGIGTPNPGGYRTATRGSTDDNTAGALWVSGLTAGIPGLMVRNDGNVGIGTATPGKKLDVAGHIRWGASGEGVLTYDGTNTYIDAALAGGATNFRNNIGTVVMKLQSDGNIGIGTTIPQTSVHLERSGTTDLLLKDSSQAVNQKSWLIRNSTASFKIGRVDDAFTTLSPNFVITNDGKVGIGTVSPAVKLSLDSGVAADSNYMSFGQNGDKTWIGSETAVNRNFIVYDRVNSAYRMVIDNNGYVGIGVTSPGYRLQLPNTATAAGQGQANAWPIYSDGRVKTDKKDIGYGISDIMKIESKRYFHHSSEFESGSLVIKSEGKNTIGFIAQDLQKIIPEAVNKPKDDSKELWSVDYNKLVPVLVRAMQELKKENDELKSLVCLDHPTASICKK